MAHSEKIGRKSSWILYAFSGDVAIETFEGSTSATYDGLNIGVAVQYREDLQKAPTSCNLLKMSLRDKFSM